MQPDISVVIAEDEYLIALDVAKAAKMAGYNVLGIAHDGEEALDLIHKSKPDVAILDIKMPKLNGIETAKKLQDDFSTSVVIMTAYESDEFLQSAKDAGVGAYLIKPPEAESIRRAVELAVARHEDMAKLRKVNTELREAMDRIQTLEGILPICASCKKIRDEVGHWSQVEAYISRRSKVQFSHGFCPDCLQKLYPEFVDD